MKKIEILSIHNLFYFLFILVLIFGFTTIVDLRPNSQTQTGNAISGEWTSYTSAFSGSGIESDPYEITSAENLAYLALQVNNGTTYDEMYFKQTADIDLSAHYWVPIGTGSNNFKGTYDGDGHTISKMTFNKLYDNTMALFGGFAGLITNLGVIDTAFPANITAEVDNTPESINIANIVGTSNGVNVGDIINCYSSADIDININVNINVNAITTCNIAGINTASVSASNCYNTGDIKVSVTNSNPNQNLQLNIEGIGQTSHNCYNTGSIDCEMNGKYSTVYIAGIGVSLGNNCFNAGNIDINANNSTITSFLNVGGIGAYEYVILGTTVTSRNGYNTGNINVSGYGVINDVYVGGICGYASSSKGLFTTATINLSDFKNTGAIAITISGSATTLSAGGILGYAFAGGNLNLSRCQNTGDVSSKVAGGIIGTTGNTTKLYVSNCIYGGNCTLNYGIGSSSSNSGCTKQSNLTIDVQPKIESWYTESSNWNTSYPWDFEDTWMINSGLNDGYPVFQWQLNQLEYIINLNANGGTLNIGGQTTVPYGSSYTMPSTSSVTRTGYTLTGWKAVIENSTYTYTPGQTITIPTWSASQTTVTFYAQWQVNTYVVSFDAANYISYPVTSVAFNGSGGDFTYSNIDNEIVHSFKFRDNVNMYDASTGFYIDLSALTAEEEYEWSIYVKSTRSHAISIGQEQGGKINAEVTTEWTRITHKFKATPAGAKAFVIYRGSGSWEVGEVFEFKNLSIQKASDTPADQATGNITVTYGQKYTNLPVPTRYGYVFDGWYTSEEEDADKITKDSVVTIASNHTLYSRWTAKTNCVLTFNANEGTVSPASRNQTFNAALGTLPVPTRTGYIFTGWYTQASRGSEVTSSTIMKSERMTIYAHWAETWAASHYSSALTQNGGYWLISSSADLARVLYLLNYTTRTDVLTMKFKLTNHIDMSAYYWLPIGTEIRPFGGVIDGQGYTIKGLHTISQSERRDNGGDNSGFIGVSGSYTEKSSTGVTTKYEATIKNIYFEDISINGRNYVAGVVGSVLGDTTISAIAVVGKIYGTNIRGGIAAYAPSTSLATISDCLVDVSPSNIVIRNNYITATNSVNYSTGKLAKTSGTFTNWIENLKGMKYTMLPKGLTWIAEGK